jgi:hypothetical protein
MTFRSNTFSFAILAVTLVVLTLPVVAANKTSATSGNWGTASTWSPSGVPANGDNVIIATGTVVTINVNTANVNDLTVQAGATLQGDGTNKVLTIGKGGGEDATNLGTVNLSGSNLASIKFNRDCQMGGSGGTWQLSTVDLNNKKWKFTAGATIEIRLSGAGNPLSRVAAGAGQVTPGSTVVFNYNGTAAQSLHSTTSVVYSNLHINNPAGVSLGVALSSTNLTGNLRVQSGVLENNSMTIAGVAAATFEVGNGGTFVMQGTTGMVTGFGTKSFGTTSTVDYAGANQTVSLESYGNLRLSGSGSKTMPASSMVVAGNFEMTGTASASANAPLSIGGDVHLNSSATLNAGNLSHTFGGTFTNDGTFAPAASTITMDCASAQDIKGTSVTTFNNLVVNNSVGIVLESNAVINGVLTFNNGKIYAGDKNLSFGPASSITGLSATRYIVTDGTGTVTLTVGTSPVLFPVGTSSSYNPITITNEFGTDSYSVKVIDALTASIMNNDAAVNRTWVVTEGTPGGNGDVTLVVQWNQDEEGSSFNRPAAVSWRHNGSAWVPDGVVTSVSGSDPYTATIVGMSELGSIAIGNDGALPIHLAYFNGMAIPSTQNIELSWGTVSETNNFGFYVQRSVGTPTAFADLPNSFVPGHGTTLEPQHYSWTHVGVAPGTYYYRLKQVDFDATIHYTDPIQVVMSPLSGVENPDAVPQVFALHQNYPNPFNPTTNVQFTVARAGVATVKVYNLIGQEVATLFQGMAEPGRRYNVAFDASNLANGIYMYKLAAQDQASVRKMILLK